MRLVADNLWATVQDATDEELTWLASYLSVPVKNAEHSDAFQAGHWDGMVRLFDKRRQRFASGLIRMVHGRAKENGIRVVVDDVREKPDVQWNPAAGAWLRDYQRDALGAMLARGRGIVSIPTGGGKCLGSGTMVMLFDGTTIPVEQVEEGNLLMGPDGQPRTVKATTSGVGPLFQITPTKGEPWICNDVHVLTLVKTCEGKDDKNDGRIIDVPLDQWHLWSRFAKHTYKLFRVGIDFQPGPPLPIDPYFLGVLLGDGCLGNGRVMVTKPDQEIRQECEMQAAKWGLGFRVEQDTRKPNNPTYHLTRIMGTEKQNPLRTAIGSLGLAVNGEFKFVPASYKVASRFSRLEILAGLIDTDGSLSRVGFDFISASTQLSEDVAFLARSVGLAAYVNQCRKRCQTGAVGTYWRVSISGDTESIPTRIHRKKAPLRRQKKNVLRTGFKVEPIGYGNYFGFELDGDGRFLLADFTVTHNTVLMAAAVQALPVDWLVLVDTRDLMHQGALAIAKLIREDVGECGDGIWRPRRVTVATLQTLYQGVGTDGRVNALLERARGLLCDEVQTVSAPQAHKVALTCPNAYYRFGVSATPLEREDEADYRAIEALGPLIYEIDAKPLIDAGWLARPEIYFVEFQHEKMTGSYAEVYEAGIVFSDKRNELVARLASTALAPRPTLVFFKKHAHAPRLERLINRAATVEVIDGRNNTRARDKARHRLVTGQIDVLMTSKIFNKGIDMPQVESAVNAAAGASSTDALQKVGRIMRPLGGQKTVVRFWDVMDLRNRWFADHARRRLDAFRGRGYDVHVVSPGDVAALARAA